jgi:hypothetical protein
MGVLVKVENGAKKFWEKKFHATNGKAQPTLKVSCFFLLSFGGKRGRKEEIFFHFPFVPASSQFVPMGFLLSFGGEGVGERKIFFIFPLFQQVSNVSPMGVPNRTLL